MSPLVLLGTLVVVFCISAGQIMFKLTARAWNVSHDIFDPHVYGWFLAAITLYALTTFGWIGVLTRAPLSKAYPFMALGFVLVPLVSRPLFGEQLGVYYTVGTTLIVMGLILVTR